MVTVGLQIEPSFAGLGLIGFRVYVGCGVRGLGSTLRIKIAQKPYTIGSLGPKALKHTSFEGEG